jgi:hypothetical protein
LWPSLLRGSSVVRDFLVENFSSQKPRTREGILYLLRAVTSVNVKLILSYSEGKAVEEQLDSLKKA